MTRSGALRWLLVLAGCLLLAGCGQAQPTRSTPKTVSLISGASQAVCSPSPCLPQPTPTAETLPNVSNDDGTTSPRAYEVYRPQNLAASPGNLAPAVLDFYGSGNCGFVAPGRFVGLAPTDRFIVVAMEIPCGRNDNWNKRNIESPTTSVPNDEPYVAAVVHDITQCPATGAGPNQCVDPQRIYAAGLSSGGSMVGDIMCDVQNSTLFRGYLIDSSSLELFNGQPHCPSPNRSYFVMLAVGNSGIDAGIYNNTTSNAHLDVPGFADWAGNRLGCPKTRTDDAIGSPVASTLRYRYFGPCAYAVAGSAAVETLGIQNGAHGFGCQDSDAAEPPNVCPSPQTMPNPPGLTAGGLPQTNGLFVEQEFWNFVASGVSTSTPASLLADTIPPYVAMSAPANGSTVSGNVALKATATDDTAVAEVQFQVDGSNLGGEVPSGSGTSYATTWNTAAASNGLHPLTAIARDTSGNLTTSAPVSVTVHNALSPGLSQTAHTTWAALGDAYSSGGGNPPYLGGKGSASDRCQRSQGAYPVVDAPLLGFKSTRFAFHACSSAKVGAFYRANRQDPDAPQLKWVAPAALVSLTIGWADSLLPAAIRSCAHAPGRCNARWRRVVTSAIASLGKTSARTPTSLYQLFRKIVSAAPHAKVLVVGYPRLFPRAPAATCQTGAPALTFTRATMSWINAMIAKLDHTIQTAASRAHVAYVSASYGAFAGHEACTRKTYVNGSLYPNRQGQLTLAKLVKKAL